GPGRSLGLGNLARLGSRLGAAVSHAGVETAQIGLERKEPTRTNVDDVGTQALARRSRRAARSRALSAFAVAVSRHRLCCPYLLTPGPTHLNTRFSEPDHQVMRNPSMTTRAQMRARIRFAPHRVSSAAYRCWAAPHGWSI